MRAFIIVTVQDESHSFTYDVEVPVNVPARKLAGDIVEALNYYHRSSKGEKLLPKSSYAIANRRTGKTLDPAKTFYEGGCLAGGRAGAVVTFILVRIKCLSDCNAVR